MNRIRTPRDLDVYIPSDEALRRLEQIARVLRERASQGDLMKWDMTLWFFNEKWNYGNSPNEVCSRTRFKSGPEHRPARIGQTVVHHPDALGTGQ